MSQPYTDKQFTKDFKELTAIITKRLQSADSTDEVQEELSMLEGLATNKNAPAAAKTIYGLAYLMEDKQWYDFKKGFDAVMAGADEAQENESFCWFILGSLYLNGKPDLPKDIVSAKYWIKKAVDAGYKDAALIYELNWGDNPPGFKEWMTEKIEKDYDRKQKLKRWLPITLILAVIGLIVYITLFR